MIGHTSFFPIRIAEKSALLAALVRVSVYLFPLLVAFAKINYCISPFSVQREREGEREGWSEGERERECVFKTPKHQLFALDLFCAHKQSCACVTTPEVFVQEFVLSLGGALDGKQQALRRA